MKTKHLLFAWMLASLLGTQLFGQNSDCLTPSGAMQQPTDPLPTCFAGYTGINTGALTQFFTFTATTANMAVELTPDVGTACSFPNTAINYSNFELYSTIDCGNLLSTSSTFTGLTIGASYTFGLTMTPQDPSCVWISQTCPKVVEVTIPMAAELLYFTGRVNGSDVTLSWNCEASSLAHRFEIKRRSSALLPFETVGTMEAAPQGTEFTWQDAQPVPGRVEYLLEIIDQNGTRTTSNVLQLDVNANHLLQLFPNPCTNYMQVHFPESENQQYRLVMFNLQGKAVLQLEGNASTLNAVLPSIVSQLQAGAYVLQSFDGKASQAASFIKI